MWPWLILSNFRSFIVCGIQRLCSECVGFPQGRKTDHALWPRKQGQLSEYITRWHFTVHRIMGLHSKGTSGTCLIHIQGLGRKGPLWHSRITFGNVPLIISMEMSHWLCWFAGNSYWNKRKYPIVKNQKLIKINTKCPIPPFSLPNPCIYWSDYILFETLYYP